jgi:hypothetical protein
MAFVKRAAPQRFVQWAGAKLPFVPIQASNLVADREYLPMKAFALAGLIALLAPSVICAACPDLQDGPTVPDGATASREEMLAATKAVSEYNAAVDQYVECLRKNGGNLAHENRAIDKLNSTAKKFNAEVRTFKKRSSG